MNTSVSPLPLPIWPMLALSAALVVVTAAAVTFSSQRVLQVYPSRADLSLETEAPGIVQFRSLRPRQASVERADL